MSRVIKFRAWSPIAGKWRMGLPFEPFDPVFMAQGGTFPEGSIFMQFTGLLDKNGKEIYEGDLVQRKVDNPFKQYHGEFSIHEIVYRSGMWILSYWKSKGDLPRGYLAGEINQSRENQHKEMFFSDQPIIHELEVIGNLYENSKLLEDDCTHAKEN